MKIKFTDLPALIAATDILDLTPDEMQNIHIISDGDLYDARITRANRSKQTFSISG